MIHDAALYDADWIKSRDPGWQDVFRRVDLLARGKVYRLAGYTVTPFGSWLNIFVWDLDTGVTTPHILFKT